MLLKRLFSRRVKTVFGTVSAFLLAFSSTAAAADGTWNVDADGAWSTASNWASSVIADGAGFTAILNKDITAARTITLDTSRTIGGIRIGDPASGTNNARAAYTLAASNGSILTLDNGASDAVIMKYVNSEADVISVPLVLNSSLTLANMANDKGFTLSGTIASGTTGLKTITVTGQGAVTTANPVVSNLTTGAITLSGVISDGTAGQLAIKLDSVANSTLTLSGANTFTGGVTLDSGTLVIANATALGGTGSRFTINGGYLAGSGSPTVGNALPMTWNGSFAFTGTGSSDLTLSSGTATMGGNIEVAVLARQFNVPGIISDGGNAYSLTKSGVGTLYLQGNNTYTGGTVVEAGTLVIKQVAAFGGTGRNVLVKFGASVSMVSTGMNQAFLDRIATSSIGSITLWSGSSSANALDFSALPDMRLGTSPSGTATYSGTLTPYGSTFRLGGGGGTLVVSGVLAGSGRSLEVGIRGASVGNITLSGANTYSGNTTIYGPATLQLNGNTGRVADSSNILFVGNGTFRYDNTGATAAIAETVGSLQFQAGDGTVLSQRTAAFGTALTVAGISRSAGATGNFTVGGTGAAFDVNSIVIGSSAPAAGTFLDQGLFAGGSGYAAYDAAGYVRALNYGADADTATVSNDATVSLGADKHVNLTGAVSALPTTAFKTLRISSATNATLAVGSTLTLTSGGILKTGNNTATLAGGTGITTGAAELVVRTDQSSDVLNLNTSILASSTGGVTKSGAGTLVLNADNSYGGVTTVNAGTLRATTAKALSTGTVVMNGGTLDLRMNASSPGNNNGTPETFALGNNVEINGDSAIAVNSTTGTSVYQNKTLQLGSLALGGNTLTVTNTNGYGLEFAGTTTLSAGSTGDTILNLATARPSNLVQALTLSGKVTGSTQLTIRGAGTLQLTNATNDFIGDIRVSGSVLAAANDGALGSAANKIRLADSASGSTFRATGTFATSHTIVLANEAATTNIIQVVNGQTFTLNSAFEGNNGFTKSDSGTFEINAANTAWDGDVLIHDGVLKISHSAALGTAAGITQVNNIESALHLNGGATGLTIAENLFLFSSGINNTGALLSLAGPGTNIVAGAIKLDGPAVIGVETGGTLALTSASAVTGNTDLTSNGQLGSAFALTLAGGGFGSLASPIATGSSTLTKLGAGTWTLTGASTFTGAAIVNQGTLVLSGSDGKLAAGSAWQISPGATLVLDNTDGHLDNRLGTRGVHFGGNITVIGDSSANTLETITSSNLVSGNTASILTLDADPTRALTFRVTGGSFTRSGQGTSLYRGDNLGSTPGAGVATMLASTAPAFVGQSGAAGSVNRGILPWIIVDTSAAGLGAAFATYNSTNGIMALNAVAGEQAAYVQATANVAVTGAKTSLGPVTINSLNLGSGGSVTNLPLQALTLDSGGLLALAGNGGVQGGILTTSNNRDVIVHALGDITISAVIANTTGGLTKTGAGTLTLSQRNYYTGSTSINQGTLVLSGGSGTLAPGQVMNLNDGGTLDLNGTTQMLGALRSYGSSGNEAPITGGTVTSSGGAATLVTSTSTGTTFAGQITGNVSLQAALGGGATWVLTSDNTYSGGTLVAGGIVSLRNDGRLSNTSAIALQYGTLRLDNSVLSDNADRVADDADITMSGATLNLFGRPGAFSSETVGNVMLSQGMNIITSATSSNNGNVMPQSAMLTLTSLNRNAAAGATVNFGQSYTGTSADRLGIVANSSGTAENIVVTGGLPTANNIVGPWAVYTYYFNTSAMEFVGYDAAGGVGALNVAGFAGYDGTSLPATSQPAQNIRTNADATVPAGGLTINTFNFIGNSATPNRVLTFTNDTDVLNLAAGGLLFSSEAGAVTGSLGAASGNGRITAGGTNPSAPVDLFLFYQNSTAANALTVNAGIIDNPTNNQSVRLIVSGTVFGQFPVVLASTLNTYTGGTIVNGEILQVGNATAAGNLPAGGLTINGGTVTQVNGAIAAQDVTLNGPSVMNLIGTNTLNAIAFNNNGGGSTTPSINIAAGATLNMAGNISATSSNPGSTAAITGGTLSLNGASRTVAVAPITFNGQSLSPDQATLSIASVISGTGAGLVKTGQGLLQLGGANTFNGGVNLQEGGLVIASDGALGTGTLSIGSNTTLTADATARTLANAVTVGGDFTLGVRGVTAPAALTLAGAVTWGTTSHQVTVDSNPATVQTISGAVSGSGALVKDGIGTLALTSTTSTVNWTDAGDVKVNNGTLRLAADTSLGTAPATATAGNIVLNGGALGNTATMALDSKRGIALGNATGSGTGSLEAAASTTLTYNGVITDNGSGADNLVKSGTGTLSLGGASTYTGHTTIAAGTLALSASGSINSSDRITVNTGASFTVTSVSGGYSVKSGQTLEGGGTVNGNVTAEAGAAIAPGAVDNRVADKLTFTNVVTLNSGSVLKLDINAPTFASTNNFGGNAPGTAGYNSYVTTNGTGQKDHDLLSAATLTQNAGAQIQVVAAGLVPVEGQIFNLLDWTTAFNASTNLGDTYRSGATDSTSDLDLPDISSFGLMWDISNFASAGVLVVVVPEPGRCLLLFIAFAALGIRRRRRVA